jgi:hypothetical protein
MGVGGGKWRCVMAEMGTSWRTTLQNGSVGIRD